MKCRDSRKYHALFIGVVFLAVALVPQESGSQQAQQAVYSWAVVPQFTGLAVHRDWTPILTYISQETGLNLQLSIYDSIPDFEVAFLNGAPDFAYMNPYHAVMAKREQGYVPIVRDDARRLTGILVVRNESSVKSIHDLEGRIVAFPSPNAFAASLYMRAQLREKEHLKFEPHYADTHSNAYRWTLLGKSAASGAVLRTLRKESQAVQDSLRIIYRTPDTPSHPLTVHPRVPKSVRDKIQAALLRMAQTRQGSAWLKVVLLPRPIVADYARDYQPLEALNLEEYVVRRRKR